MSAPRRLGAAEIRQLLDERAIVPSKGLGQNFVIDPNTIDRIVRLAAADGARVIEIGPGLGSLSLALAEVASELTLVEIDARLVDALRTSMGQDVRIVQGDALHLDWSSILSGRADYVLVANLPYNVATPLIIELLETQPLIARMVVMVQREVGERLAAGPGSREYGQVSVRVDYFADARVIGRVPASVFFPRPNVESVLVSIDRRARPAVAPELASYGEIVTLVRAGFGTRRKMLRRALAPTVTEVDFDCAGIASSARAEELGIEQWGKLAACLRQRLS